jgi:DNA-binding CsgD family transcriptional regulator
MRDSDHLELINSIYDATLDSSRWDVAFEQTCKFIDGVMVAVGSLDLPHREISMDKVWGYDTEYLKSYRSRYNKVSPLIPIASSGGVGDPIAVSDNLRYEEFQRTTFFREWANPQGLIDALQVNLEKTVATVTFVVGVRHASAGPADEEMRRRMHLLWPHFRRALSIGKTIDLHKVEAAAFADTFDGLAPAVFLVDADAHIVHANVSGHALLERGATLCRIDGKLVASDARANHLLRSMFASAAAGDETIGTQGIAVPISAGDGERSVAYVLSLTAGTRRRVGNMYSAVAAVFVRRAALDMRLSLQALADTFELTPAEMRVLATITEVGGVHDTARVLGVAETTIKTHLKHIFEKTGTKRQTDLIKLVNAYAGPFD